MAEEKGIGSRFLEYIKETVGELRESNAMDKDVGQQAIIRHAQNDLSKVGPDVAAQPTRSLWDKASDFFIDKFAPEVGDMLMHKAAQGAAELGQALNSSADAYVPYGAGQAPLTVEGPATAFQDMLRDAARYGQDQGQDRQQGMDR
jgi:hypothetical protein